MTPIRPWVWEAQPVDIPASTERANVAGSSMNQAPNPLIGWLSLVVTVAASIGASCSGVGSPGVGSPGAPGTVGT